ncbi:unnamed protein product (macronuclear) [Paramecium tetraurelia]|uniref:BZIP domain-containing protein n=1 Tax=Paramecium tetraurelia TaxID=5888 RepID=A0C6I5_PARTE|nr:uncharacterized protein GSPATT00035531001 [Paramecium tetraurelia]CAK66402.1 unnamed protein product [Paramecium tetraurelia]|eukprot:XP_001433799.1 hypothetical protein (macronuclear) [Paramecium tetraurelia strain d4-2]
MICNTIQQNHNINHSSSSEELSNDKKGGLTGYLSSANDLFREECKNKRLRQSAKKSRLRKKVY